MVAANVRRRVTPGNAEVMIDSGAFGDKDRLTYKDALDRQLEHEKWSSYCGSAIVSYDRLIDEKWTVEGRKKQRWDEAEAWSAVKETIAAADFLASRNIGQRSRVLSIQGVTPKQQAYCADAVCPMLTEGDILGMGGWCIIGWYPPKSDRRKEINRVFWDSAWHIVEAAAKNGVQRIHLFGVMVAPILGGLRWLCDEFGVGQLSTDSSGPSTRPAQRKVWGYADWARPCSFPEGEQRGRARIQHVAEVRNWLFDFRATQYYRCPPTKEEK